MGCVGVGGDVCAGWVRVGDVWGLFSPVICPLVCFGGCQLRLTHDGRRFTAAGVRSRGAVVGTATRRGGRQRGGGWGNGGGGGGWGCENGTTTHHGTRLNCGKTGEGYC